MSRHTKNHVGNGTEPGGRKALRVLILGRHRRVIDRIIDPLRKRPLQIDWALRNASALDRAQGKRG